MALNLYTHSNGRVYKSDEGQLVSISNTYTGDEETGVKTTVASATTQVLNIKVTKTLIQSMVLYAAGTATYTTKLATVTKDTFSLTATNMVEGNNTIAGTNPIPLTSDFDELDMQNAGATAVVCQARFLMNQ